MVNALLPARLVGLAALTAIAALVRHDHGLYIGIASAFAVALSPVLSDRFRRPSPLRAGGVSVGMLAGFALMAVLSARTLYDDVRFGETSPGIGVPQWWYTMWLPILSVAIAGRALGLFFRRGRQP